MDAQNRTTRLLFATMLLLTLAGSANAYVDAGSGSYLLQVAIAGMLGAAFTAKSYWGHFKAAVLSRIRSRSGDTASNEPIASRNGR